MKIRAVLLFVLLLGLSSHVTFAFDKKDFYKVLASDAPTEIEEQFNAVKTLSLPERDAYEGALMMKKAGLQKDKKAQLKLFKEGKVKLEGAITKEPENCEFRLLRLIIQENAPSALGYNKQIEQDCSFIGENYKSAPSVLKTIIRDYSKQSQKLKLPA